jgi:hypothetical protein
MSDVIRYAMLGDKKLVIKKFSLETMADSPAIMLVAKRRSGKSWVCRDILRHFNNIPVGMIIAKSEKKADEPFYSEFFPDSFIFYEYNEKILKNLFYRQEQMIEKSKEKKEKGIIIDPRAIFLMDDCLSDKGTWAKDPLIYELMFNGRHYKILFMLTMQSPLGISPELRSNFDYFFLLATDIENHMKKLYENYAGMFRNVKEFRTVFKQLTVDHQSMVIANTSADRPFQEKVYWYKATNTKIDMVGCKQFKDYHNKNYDLKWYKNKPIYDQELLKK